FHSMMRKDFILNHYQALGILDQYKIDRRAHKNSGALQLYNFWYFAKLNM
ncbi:hypothetical protein AVEN_198197-2-1, partial [Araneus ventricosus]